MGFWITIYKIRSDIPLEIKEMIVDSEEILPGVYEKEKEFDLKVQTLEDVKSHVEESEKLCEKDIVEWSFDDDALKNPSEEMGEMVRTRSNYFIMKVFGLEQVAIDKEMVFVELTLQEIARQLIE